MQISKREALEILPNASRLHLSAREAIFTRMSSWLLTFGLLTSGAAGFLIGANPALLARAFRKGPAQADRDAQVVMDFLFPLAVAFFAGFVFSTLVPEAMTHSRGTLIAFVCGAAAMWALSKLVFKRDPCCEVGHDHKGFGAVSLAAMAVCSLNDGLLLGLLDPPWYSGLNIGMIIHKITSSFAIAQILRQTRFRGVGLAAFGIVYTLISPLALLATRSSWFRNLPDVELLLAFSAGLLAYVTLSSLVPHARAIMRRRPSAAFGFVAAFLIAVSLGFWHTSLHRKLEGSVHGAPVVPVADGIAGSGAVPLPAPVP